MSRDHPQGPCVPIRVAARRTGLQPHLIRSWERRYRAIVPHRTPGGHRCFYQADIERLYLLRLAIEGGRTIGQVARHDDARLRQLVGIEESHCLDEALGTEPRAEREPGPGDEATRLLEALEAFDEITFRRVLDEATRERGLVEVAETVALPLLELYLDPAARAFVRHEIMSWAAAQPHPLGTKTPSGLLATAGGEEQPVFALADAVATQRRWRVVAVGEIGPNNDLSPTVAQLRPRTLIVVAASSLDHGLLEYLPTLALDSPRERAPVADPSMRVIVTGTGTASLRRWTPTDLAHRILWAPRITDLDRLLTRRRLDLSRER